MPGVTAVGEPEIGCETMVCDLADMEATRRAAISAQPIDLLVNNAGATQLDPCGAA